ncbi:MAG: helix-turn-helix domain-containing protein [Bdellovibrionales bacterium]
MESYRLKALKECRSKAGFTQKEVEDKLDLRSLTIRDYEVGRLKLPMSVALNLADLYQASLDELIGNNKLSQDLEIDNTLLNFQSIFQGNGFEVMFVDPLIQAFVLEHQELFFKQSIFEVLTHNFKESERKDLVVDISKMLSSLAGVDGKVSKSETRCIQFLMHAMGVSKQYKDVRRNLDEIYFPESKLELFSDITMKHFVVWLLFFFAQADLKINEQEIDYIKKVGEVLRVSRSNFLFIKSNFINKESI